MATVTIKFRGKLTDSGSVKVPALTGAHIDLRGNEDTTATIFVGGLANRDVTRARLANMRGAVTGDYYWPGWASEADGFTVKPIGNGFMADVSIKLDTDNVRRKH